MKMGAEIGKTAEERAVAEELINNLDEKETMRLLRYQTTLLVLMVRVDNQEERKEWKDLHEEIERS